MMYHGLETLRHYACSYAIFGVADLQGAKSFVGKNEIGILTKLRFKIVDNWKAGSIPKDQFFDLIIPGGEVMHKGEMFRLGDPLTSYVKGRRYLMIIQGDTENAEKNYFVELPRLLEVSNGIIRAPYSATPFDGMSLSRVKASAQEALEQKGCE
ncbi:hypothetical protein ASC95_12100 [Pelomonas sp. Root1217]|nr:hypothetical protein ASC95_12100 [Pelomonas sp. Root1217]